VFRLGWQVCRARFGEDVAPHRFRRAVVVGAVVGVIAAVALGMTAAHTGWPGGGTIRSTAVVVLASSAAALITTACFPVARIDDPAATIDGEPTRPETMRLARDSVQRYLGRRMPEMQPEDSAAVLHDTALVRRTLVVDVTRATSGLLGLSFAGIGLLVTGDRHTLRFTVAVIYLSLIPFTILRLGRTERAHRAATTLPPIDPPATTPSGRNRFPSGSKVGLPGD
jgi:hypothetical protein